MTLGLTAACAASNDDEAGGGTGGTLASTTGLGGAGSNSVSASSGVQSSSATSTVSTVTSTTASDASVTASASTGPNLCGNGTLDPGEFCDMTDFGGKTCQDFGLSQGDLVCNPFCGIVVTGCTPFENCFDEDDNDNDGDIDCADSECMAEPGCVDSCASPLSANVPEFGSGNLAGKPNVIHNSCSANDGPEVVWRVTAPMDGDLAVRFWTGSGLGSVAFRTACDDAGTELGCAAMSGGNDANLARTVTAGTTLYVVFEDATVASADFYNFDIDIPPPEAFCDDFFDDDHDGFTDCDDPDLCQTLFECTPQPGARPYGSECFSNNECQANANDPVCLGWQQGFDDGYCSEFCDLATDDCSGDGVCLETGLSPIHGICWDGCVTDLDCGPGLGCVESGIPGTKICANPPELSCNDTDDNDGDGLVDCEDKTSCATSPQCTPGPNAAGTPCQLHNQCQANDNDPFCIDQFNFGWAGGYCTEFCDLAAPDCPAGSECVDPPLFISFGHGMCLDTCVDQTDCRPGYFCSDQGAFSICVD